MILIRADANSNIGICPETMSTVVRHMRLSLSGNCVFAVRFHVQTAIELQRIILK